MKILGEISHNLGMDVKVDIPEHTIHLSQQQYIRNTYNTFKKYGIYNYTTPMDPCAQLSKAMSPTPGSEEAEIINTVQRINWNSAMDCEWDKTRRLICCLHAGQVHY